MKKPKIRNAPFVDPAPRLEVLRPIEPRTEFTAKLLQIDDGLILRVPKFIADLEEARPGDTLRVSIRKEGKP